MLQKELRWLYSIHSIYLYLLAIVACFLISLIQYGLLIDLLGLPLNLETNNIERLGIFKEITALLVGPLLETLIFQFGLIGLLFQWQFFEERRWLSIFISATVFALAHTYHFYYILYAFFMGLILCQFYLIMRERKYAFWHTATLHMLINLFVLIGRNL